MEKEILSRCGFRCDLCLAYRQNIEKKDERKKLSDGWYKYFGFRIEPENIMCNGCLSTDNFTLDKDCTVRPCANSKGLENCTVCSEYICDKLKERIVDYNSIKTKIGHEIPEEDYENFIKPYESKQRLDTIRKNNKM
jgi:hypothetical protein